MEIKLPTYKTIIIFIFTIVLMLILLNYILFEMAKMICEESELQPVRYELGGLFSNQKIPIVTTSENADSYEKVCVRTGKPKFWATSENMNYLMQKTKTINGGSQ